MLLATGCVPLSFTHGKKAEPGTGGIKDAGFGQEKDDVHPHWSPFRPEDPRPVS